MLARQHRFQLRPQADQFFNEAKRVSHRLMSLWHRPAADFAATVVIGKKVSKIAVERNRIKRAVLRVLQEKVQQDEVPSAEIVFTVQAAASNASTEQLESTTRSLMKKVFGEIVT